MEGDAHRSEDGLRTKFSTRDGTNELLTSARKEMCYLVVNYTVKYGAKFHVN